MRLRYFNLLLHLKEYHATKKTKTKITSKTIQPKKVPLNLVIEAVFRLWKAVVRHAIPSNDAAKYAALHATAGAQHSLHVALLARNSLHAALFVRLASCTGALTSIEKVIS